MGTEKYISETKFITAPQERVYDRLSNLENLEEYFDPIRIDELKKNYPDAPDIKLDNFRATADECSFTVSSVGKIGVQITEREPSKLIKLTGSQTIPFKFTCWVQLLPTGPKTSKVKITLQAELNPMIKMMVDKHLKEGVNRIAEAITKFQY